MKSIAMQRIRRVRQIVGSPAVPFLPQKTSHTQFEYKKFSEPPVFTGNPKTKNGEYVSHALVVELLVGAGHMDADQALWWVREALRYYYCANAGQFDKVYLRNFRTVARKDFTAKEDPVGVLR